MIFLVIPAAVSHRWSGPCSILSLNPQDKSLAPFSQQSIGFITDGLCTISFGFLHTGGNEHPAVGVWLYLLPRELSDVALSQSRKTGEKKSFFQDLLLTGCFGKPYQFLLAQNAP